MLARILAGALSTAIWLQPGGVLPTPPVGGSEAPPRPYGAAPPIGPAPPPTTPALARAQDRRLLVGPFPQAGLTRGISEGALLLASPEPAHSAIVQRIGATGAHVVRIAVNWRDYVEAQPGPGFDARDPASPRYRFALLDAAVRAVAGAGLQPLLAVSHAPPFAEATPRWRYAFPGSWSPDPSALEDFAAALARRYDGTFPDPERSGATLPRVRLYQAWNEPNLARYLEPQWVAQGRRWVPFSPQAYRELLNAFYAGVKSVAPGDVVAAAGLAPNGQRAGAGRMAPLTFLRSLLCLSASGARARGRCARPAHLDALAFHPLSVQSPDVPSSSSLDVSIADAGKVTSLLRDALAARTVLPAGPKPLWVTELDWESAPQVPWGVPPRLQAAWVSRALHRLWAAGVSLVAWHFLLDPYPALRASTPTGGIVEFERPAGLYSAGPGGNPAGALAKPFLQGFALPFDPLRVDPQRVRVWALLESPFEQVVVQRGVAGGWETLARLRAGRNGVLNALVDLRGAARLRLQEGSALSAPAGVPASGSGL
jgi:hypothetical protein